MHVSPQTMGRKPMRFIAFGLKKNNKLQRAYNGRKNTRSQASLTPRVFLAF